MKIEVDARTIEGCNSILKHLRESLSEAEEFGGGELVIQYRERIRSEIARLQSRRDELEKTHGQQSKQSVAQSSEKVLSWKNLRRMWG